MEQAEKTKEKGKSGVNETVNEVDVSSDHDGGEGSFIHLAADEEEQDNTNDVQVSKYADAVNFIEDYFDVKLWEDEDFAHLHPTAPLYDDNEDDEDLVMIEMDDTSL